MKSMTKQQLADKAGASVNTLNKWCKPFQKELEAMGIGPNDRLLHPKAAKLVIKNLDIDI